MPQLQTSNVIGPLENVRERVTQRLMQVPEYRSFLAMEKPIAEVANIPDLVAHLQTAQQKILERLSNSKEYRALLTVEKVIQDLSQVLEVVCDGRNFDGEPAPSEEVLANEECSNISSLPVPEPKHAVDETGAVASIGKTPTVAADEIAAVIAATPVMHSQDTAELLSSIEAAGEQGGIPISNPAAQLLTPGFLEESRLTTMVRESFSASEDHADDLYVDDGGEEADKVA